MDMNFEWRTRNERLLVVAYWWEMQQGKCCICGDEMEHYHRDAGRNPNAASIEHLIPKRDRGPNTVGNVRLAHRSCNNRMGALWEMNRIRALGLEERQTTANSPRHRRSKPHPDLIAAAIEQDAKLRKGGVSWNAGNAISLPRGATLLPEMQQKLRIIIRNRIPKPKMTATETARWLAKQGIRGS